MAKILLEMKNITKTFGPVIANDKVNLDIYKGEILSLLGENGSGKTTLIKILAGILNKNDGEVTISGKSIGIETKKIVSYLPERTYFSPNMRVKDTINFFEDFYEDFRTDRAKEMLAALRIEENARIRALSKGTREKVQLILVMSRDASLYILDEPIAGVDPAARDYILRTIITNYNENATVLISTHLITDIENILDEVVFMKEGRLLLQTSVEEIREEKGKSVDAYFREVFAC